MLNVEIDMWSDLAGIGMAIDEAGPHQPHGHPLVDHRKLFEEEARAIRDLDLMTLGDRCEAPAPDREQAAVVVNQPEPRIVATNEAILFVDRERAHGITSSSGRGRRRSYGPARGEPPRTRLRIRRRRR